MMPIVIRFVHFRILACIPYLLFFFFNDTATTEIYTLSLHDALPIYALRRRPRAQDGAGCDGASLHAPRGARALGDEADRKSTRLNSSHGYISYAVFCLKKKKKRKKVK